MRGPGCPASADCSTGSTRSSWSCRLPITAFERPRSCSPDRAVRPTQDRPETQAGSGRDTVHLAGPPVPDWARRRTGETLVELLDLAAGRTPDSTAMAIARGRRRERWTYRQLLAASRRAAASMMARGVEPGDRIVTWSGNEPW